MMMMMISVSDKKVLSLSSNYIRQQRQTMQVYHWLVNWLVKWDWT